ncbi:MAG: Iron-sulfur cluster-binding protein [Ktedonobacterales bacterium]|nr:MAG: Iron-sulfur cluster-binding protein [Ktedonobacterales bacterium]
MAQPAAPATLPARREYGGQEVVTLHTRGDIAAAAHHAIELLGGMRAILAGRTIAVLKPNFVAGRPARTGATTNLDLLAAVAAEVHAAGAQPYLCESSGTEFDDASTYTILGIADFCREHDIGMVGRVDSWTALRPPGARRLKHFSKPAILDDACLINLPVLKTHVVSGMSVAMKNLMGLLPREDRRTMHTLGIQQCIVDMNLGLRPDLNIVDGSVGQDGDGPLYGRQANLGVLVAGRDSLAVDLVCCRLVNVDPHTIGHLRLGEQQMGRRRPHLLGDEIAPLSRFELPQVKPLYRFAFWLMYPLDYPFARLTGTHLCTALYSTGLVGTRPQISAEACTHCGICVEACPLPNVINLDTLQVNPRTCQRCLLCYEACPEGAISVKGMSGAAGPVAAHGTHGK